MQSDSLYTVIKVCTIDHKCSCHSDLLNSSSHKFHTSSNRSNGSICTEGGGELHNTFQEPHLSNSYLDTVLRIEVNELPSYTKAPPFLKYVFRICQVLIKCVQSFPLKMIYWAVVSVFKDKIPVPFLQIQGLFKEKVIFKEFSRTEQIFQETSRPMRTMAFH